MGAIELANRAENVANHGMRAAEEAVQRGDLAAAKKILTEAVRELRDCKRAAADEERELRAQFQAARTQVSGSGQLVGAFLGSKGRSAIARGRAASRRNLAEKEQATLLPYARLKSVIDNVIAQLNAAKGDIPVSKAEKAPRAPKADDLAGQIKQLAELRDQGVLSDEEFEAAKRKALGL